MPMAARLHSVGRVLMAAGNQRASMKKRSFEENRRQKKGLVRQPGKSFEAFQLLGEERAQCAKQSRC
jgi:hypothetical protein